MFDLNVSQLDSLLWAGGDECFDRPEMTSKLLLHDFVPHGLRVEVDKDDVGAPYEVSIGYLVCQFEVVKLGGYYRGRCEDRGHLAIGNGHVQVWSASGQALVNRHKETGGRILD